MSRRTASLVLVGASVSLLASCTSFDQTSRQYSAGQPTPPPAWAGSAQPGWSGSGPAPAIAGARYGGTLTVVGGQAFPLSLDPSDNYYVNTLAIESDLLVRSLTQYVYDPQTRQMKLIPDLATDLGHPNRDYTVWRYTLRPGIRYDNGRAVRPADVKFGIERSFDRTAFPYGAPYSNEFFLDGQSYHGPYQTPGPYRGVQISGRTLTLKMSRPFPDLPYWLSYPAMSPIPKGQVSNPATYKNHPWSTGPYKIQSYAPGRSLVLVKNSQWIGATDPGRHQYVDRFVFDFGTTPTTGLDQRMLSDAGRAKTTIVTENVLRQDYARFTSLASDRLMLGSSPCTNLWFPDYRRTDTAVRRALGYAFPYRAWARAKGLISGVTMQPATNLMPPGTPGRVTYNPLPDHPAGSTEPRKARAILIHAGELHFPVRFPWFPKDPVSARVKTLELRALARAGFTPEPLREHAATFVNDVATNPRARENVRVGGWCSDWPSAGTWLPDLFGGARSSSFGTLDADYSFFTSTAVQSRITSIEHLPLSEQPAAWNALETSIQDRYFPVLPLGYQGVAQMRGSNVHNAFIDSVYAMPTFKDIWLG
jgi:peptide/nickel transport system substrate-binding protein